jgi:2-(1,2-epoxy-1,2-dihydrophenyl)acetyl-CoA isomerase
MIQVEAAGEVAVIRLDRADKRNAMTPKMLANLVGAFDTALSARAIVLSGVGDYFCSGFDLTLCRDDDQALADLLTGLSRAVRAIRTAPCPVVVSAHGAAIAGGCALVAAADLAVTDVNAKLGYPVLRLGISPAVNAPALRATIGDAATRARMLEPVTISGAEALRIGLAYECLESSRACEARALAIAQELADKPRHALGYTKRWLGELDRSTDPAISGASLETSMNLVGSDEQRERLAELWRAADAKAKKS